MVYPMDLDLIGFQVRRAADELFRVSGLKPGEILVIGASTSEVLGHQIGTAGSLEVADQILSNILRLASEHRVEVAVQCCEHLNRVLVIEQPVAERYGLEVVTVIPVPKAGGALAARAFQVYRDPVVVEEVKAHAGMDIGDTLIGMHLRPVAVPVRSEVKEIGAAHLTMARTRPKMVGGERAVYQR